MSHTFLNAQEIGLQSNLITCHFKTFETITLYTCGNGHDDCDGDVFAY